MTLIIVESPTKAKTLVKLLGKDYDIQASNGHVRDLPKKKLGVDIEKGFEPTYVLIPGKEKIIAKLKSHAKKAKEVYLAADPDREGEAICWHLKEALELKADKIKRIEFYEFTKGAVKQALNDPHQIDELRVNAQQARRVLDRLVGYKISPLLWKRVRRGLSAGRVQSVAVRLICEREKEIADFIPQEWWEILADLNNKDGDRFPAQLVGYSNGDKLPEIKSQDEVKKIVEGLKEGQTTGKITKVEVKQKQRSPLPPFITSTLQQDCVSRFGYSAKQVMRLAQQLYEGVEIGQDTIGLITYMRTDSFRVAAEAQGAARQFIKQSYGDKYCPEEGRFYRSKKSAQDAHEAIRPTDVNRTPEEVEKYLTPQQLKVYKLIWQRFVASQMASAVSDQKAVSIEADKFAFRASGSRLVFPGFKKVYDFEEDHDESLPGLVEGDNVTLIKLNPLQHFTQPPPSYTEASLIKALEEKGIGRPSTYAPIISTVQDRGYVVKEQKKLKPTTLGGITNDLMVKHFPEVVDVDFTALMEEELDEILEGKRQWRAVLNQFYAPFSQRMAAAETEMEKVKFPVQETDEKCPKCGKPVVIKEGRFGKFFACTGFPECRYTKTVTESVGVGCPECGQEMIVKKTKRGRIFYGCSGYPSCKFATWDKPTNLRCPTCQKMLVEKKGGKVYCTECKKSYDKSEFAAAVPAETQK